MFMLSANSIVCTLISKEHGLVTFSFMTLQLLIIPSHPLCCPAWLPKNELWSFSPTVVLHSAFSIAVLPS